MYKVLEFQQSNKVVSAKQLCDAAEAVNKRLHDQWETSNDVETREQCWQGIKSLQQLMIEIIKEIGD